MRLHQKQLPRHQYPSTTHRLQIVHKMTIPTVEVARRAAQDRHRALANSSCSCNSPDHPVPAAGHHSNANASRVALTSIFAEAAGTCVTYRQRVVCCARYGDARCGCSSWLSVAKQRDLHARTSLQAEQSARRPCMG